MSAPTSDGSEGHNFGNQWHIPAVHGETRFQQPKPRVCVCARAHEPCVKCTGEVRQSEKCKSLLEWNANPLQWQQSLGNPEILVFIVLLFMVCRDTFDFRVSNKLHRVSSVRYRTFWRQYISIKYTEENTAALHQCFARLLAEFISRSWVFFRTLSVAQRCNFSHRHKHS